MNIIVIGGGPGGYVAAIRAAQLGGTVTLIEKQHMGGTGLNGGCIPTKCLLHSAELLEDIRRQGAEIGVKVTGAEVDFPQVIRHKNDVSKKLTGGVAGLTTLEFEPGMVNHDLKAALDVFSPYLDEKGRVVPYWHHETWHDDNGSSHIKAALLSPFITIPFVAGKITIGPWQNLTLVECDTRNRVRDIVFQVMGE